MHRQGTVVLLGVLWVLVVLGCGAVMAPPVEVTQRDSLVGLGKILLVENRGEERLTQIAFRFENPNGDVKNWVLDSLETGESVEVGWKKLDGFEVSDSARVRVSAKDFGRSLNFDLAK